MRRMAGWATVWLVAVAGACGQAAGAPGGPGQAYDVSTVKLNESGPGNRGVDIDTTYFKAENLTLAELMSEAYGVRAKLVEGLPKWAETTRFDLNAKVSDPDMAALEAMKQPARRAMLRAVLEDRFQLKVHPVTRILGVLDLEVGRGGPKFKVAPADAGPEPEDGFGRDSMSTHNGAMKAHAVKMAKMVEFLERELDQTVVDRTGLTGEYDLQLVYLRERQADGPDTPPHLATALPEQLGLKLTGGKGPVEVLVVDQVKRPEAN